MKKLATIVLAILAVCFCFNFIACGDEKVNEKDNNSTTSFIEDSVEEETAYQQLDANEKYFFDKFTPKMTSFKDPSSVKIIAIKRSTYDKTIFELTISSKNSYGGVVSNDFYFFAKTWTNSNKSITAGYILTYDDLSDLVGSKLTVVDIFAIASPSTDKIDSYTYSVSKINAAIEEYKEEQGWI